MLKTCFLIICLSTACFAIMPRPIPKPAADPVRCHQEQKQPTEDLEVRISPLEDAVVAGDTLSVRVEIWNIGTQDLFICKQFYGVRLVFCNLDLTFDPSVKGSRTQWSADGPWDEKESFANAVVRDWISIPPRHFYGAIIELSPASYPELKTAGRYRINGRYISQGLLTSVYYNGLLKHPEEVAHLPGKIWRGEVDTNSIALRVIANKK